MSQKWILLENSQKHWLYLAESSTRPLKNLTEDQGQMSLTSCLTTLGSLKIPGMLVFNAKVKMMKDQTSPEGFNVMSVKGMIISSLNVKPFSRSKRKA